LAGAVLFLLLKKRPRAGKIGLVTLFVIFYFLSIPIVSMALTNTTHEISARSLEEVVAFKPEAVVVLGSGVYREAPEYGGEARVSSGTYQRLAYGAYLADKLGRPPILVTGGFGESLQESEGFVAAKALKDWGFEDVWMETKAENTRQNALFSKDLLDQYGISRVALVTSASHAPRAADEFRKVGLEVLTCPTGYRTPGTWERGILLVVPTHHHFSESSYALRTHLARLWYRLRY
jgi:uncharacterized SAM-binding protein YcdF (DUF218 family)